LTKDPSALFLANPTNFAEAWKAAVAAASAWSAYAAGGDLAARAEAEEKAQRLLTCDDILTAAEQLCHELGVTGESRLVRLTYLIATTRLLDRPLSLIVKGQSAAGKSFTVGTGLRLFAEDALIQRTGMSEKALIYSQESLSHRMLVLYEAAALKQGVFLTYVIRSLLSEGRAIYEVTITDPKGGYRTEIIDRPGPTGLIMTTTEIEIDAETETRAVMMNADDTPEQTSAVMLRQAQGVTAKPDLSEWLALQRYLELSPTDVVIPFAEVLAEMIPPVAVRLRRDFPTLLSLIRAHALLNQTQRERNEAGAIVADTRDYGVVRELVGELISMVTGQGVPVGVRETVAAVGKLGAKQGDDGVTIRELARELKLDVSTMRRRVHLCLDLGKLKNKETREGRGRPMRLEIGEPIDEDKPLLPEIDALQLVITARRDVE
jgi:hypothetical protein